MIQTILAYFGWAFLGFWVAVIITTVILVKKNGKKYAQIGEEVKNEKRYYTESAEDDTLDDNQQCGDTGLDNSETVSED